MVQWSLDALPCRAVYCLQGIIPNHHCSAHLGWQWFRPHILFHSDNEAVVLPNVMPNVALPDVVL